MKIKSTIDIEKKICHSKDNVSFVGEKKLCTMCGTCEGICPLKAVVLTLDKDTGTFLPKVDARTCIKCKLCLELCPGHKINLQSHLTEEEKSKYNYSSYFGYYKDVTRMQAVEDDIRNNGASGGMVTAVLLELLHSGEIDGAIVTRMREDEPFETEPFIARTAKEITSAQKSKYLPNPINRILREVMEGESQQLAFVGLPCHVEALRLAQARYPLLHNRIKYVLSLFCSRTPSLNATLFLMNSLGVKREQVKEIQYRNGSHPGFLSFVLQNGDRTKLPHLDWKYWGHTFMDFFWPARCFLCPDKTGEQADMSFGDNYMPVEGRSNVCDGPSSTVIVRNDKASKVIDNIKKKNLCYSVIRMNEQVFLKDQDLIRKTNMKNRYKIFKVLGRSVPLFSADLDGASKFFLRDVYLSFNVLLAEKKISFSILYNYLKVTFVVKKIFSFEYIKKKIKKLRAVFPFTPRSFLIKKSNIEKNIHGKVVMIGGFGWLDIGDESMPHADRLNLRKLCPSAEIVMFSPVPEDTMRYHGEKSVKDFLGLGFRRDWPFWEKMICVAVSLIFMLAVLFERFGWRMNLDNGDMRQALDELSSADVLLNVGGGNLNSLMPRELYKKCTTYLAARILGVPVIISGQTIGPFARKWDALYARFCLRSVDLITFRDKETSKKRLKEIGVAGVEMFDAADDAITLPSADMMLSEKLLRSAVPQVWWDLPANRIAVMNLKGSLNIFKSGGNVSSLENEVLLMAEIADELVEQYGVKIFFLPTDYSEGVDDRDFHRKIIGEMKFSQFAVSVEEEFTDIELKGLITKADFAIGARYHFCVFAASENVPFLGMASGIYQRTKLQGIANLCGLERCYFPQDMDGSTLEDVWPYVSELFENIDNYKKILFENVPTLKKISLSGVNRVANILNER